MHIHIDGAKVYVLHQRKPTLIVTSSVEVSTPSHSIWITKAKIFEKTTDEHETISNTNVQYAIFVPLAIFPITHTLPSRIAPLRRNKFQYAFLDTRKVVVSTFICRC